MFLKVIAILITISSAAYCQAKKTGEFSYIPRVSGASLSAIDGSARGFQAGGGARFYLKSQESDIRPFVEGTSGFMHATVSGTVPLFWWGPVHMSSSLRGGYLGAGAGAEIGPARFGLRPQVRYFRELIAGAEDCNAFMVMCGVYYRF